MSGASVVTSIPDRPDRGRQPGHLQRLGEIHAGVLAARMVVMDRPGRH